MHQRASRARRTVLPVAVPVGLVLSLAVTWGSTHAAFSASTGNAGNSWQTGSVVLTHGDSEAALFSTSTDGALKPGSARSRCIRIDYTGDLPADIRMHAATPPSGATSLDPYLVMSVERGADVAGREPRLHRAGDDHVALEAHQSRREGEDHQAGQCHQPGRDDHAEHGGRAEPPLGGRGHAAVRCAGDEGGRGHGVFCASHVNVALDWVFCAPLSSLTE